MQIPNGKSSYDDVWSLNEERVNRCGTQETVLFIVNSEYRPREIPRNVF
jgi:hypothetical protein